MEPINKSKGIFLFVCLTSGSTGLAVEEGKLTKRAAGVGLGDLGAVDENLKVARIDDVEKVALVALEQEEMQLRRDIFLEGVGRLFTCLITTSLALTLRSTMASTISGMQKLL